MPVATKLSARNQIEGKIVELEVDGVMAHVTVQVGKNLIESVITRRSAEEMKLKVGDRVLGRHQIHRGHAAKGLMHEPGVGFEIDVQFVDAYL
jgi:molybdopterin-binding protein